MDATDYIVSADRKFICFESNFSKVIKHTKHIAIIQMLHIGNAANFIFNAEITLFDSNGDTPSQLRILYMIWRLSKHNPFFVFLFVCFSKIYYLGLMNAFDFTDADVLIKKRIYSMYYTICFSCCKCVIYRAFIAPTHFPEVIQLLLWAPVGSMVVRQNNNSNVHIPLLRKCSLFLVLPWWYVNNTVLNPLSFL